MTKKDVIELLQLRLNDANAEMESCLNLNDEFHNGEFFRLAHISNELTSILEDIATQEIKDMYYKGLSPRQTLLARNLAAIDEIQFCNKEAVRGLKGYVLEKCYEFEYPTRTLEDYYVYFDKYGISTTIVDGMIL